MIMVLESNERDIIALVCSSGLKAGLTQDFQVNSLSSKPEEERRKIAAKDLTMMILFGEITGGGHFCSIEKISSLITIKGQKHTF